MWVGRHPGEEVAEEVGYNLISFSILTRTRYIHLRTPSMWKISHGCCKEKIACYIYLIYGTYDQIVNVRALHGMHKNQLP